MGWGQNTFTLVFMSFNNHLHRAKAGISHCRFTILLFAMVPEKQLNMLCSSHFIFQVLFSVCAIFSSARNHQYSTEYRACEYLHNEKPLWFHVQFYEEKNSRSFSLFKRSRGDQSKRLHSVTLSLHETAFFSIKGWCRHQHYLAANTTNSHRFKFHLY